MGIYQSEYWLSTGWGMNRRETQSGTYRPYLPDKVAHLELRLHPAAAAAVSRAESSVALLNRESRYLTDTEPLARLILRSEALASSRIEGLEVSAGKLLEYEALDRLGVSHYTDTTEAAVMRNISVMRAVVSNAVDAGELTLDTICDVNRRLLEGTRAQGRAGTLRTEQNWIGGNNANPIGAVYVPPQPQYVPDLMDDLLAFCNTSMLPPLAVAAVAHAQLETIHPFVDGNGRTGRTLVHILLKGSGLAPRVVPPVSLVLATDKERYIDNLAAFRTDDAVVPHRDIQDAIGDWVEYFANACTLACERADAFEQRIGEIQRDWRERGPFRRNSAAARLIEALPGSPVVSVASAAELIGRSVEAVRLAIQDLCEKGVLVQNAKNRKSNIYVARDILDAFTAYERALATPGGDTAAGKPARPVPQRVPRERRG